MITECVAFLINNLCCRNDLCTHLLSWFPSSLEHPFINIFPQFSKWV